MGIFFSRMTAHSDDLQLNMPQSRRLLLLLFRSLSLSALYMAIQHSSSSLAWNCQYNPPPPPNPQSPFNAFYFPSSHLLPPLPLPSPLMPSSYCFPSLLSFALGTCFFNYASVSADGKLGGEKIHSQAQGFKAFHPSSTSEAIIMPESFCSSNVCLIFD